MDTTAEPGLDDDLDGPVAAPTPAELIRDPPPQPFFSWWRAFVLASVLVALGLVVVAVRAAEDTGGTANPDGVATFLPAPGGRVLRQSEIGAILQPGWDGRLTINGVPIPEEDMSGAIDPDSEAWQRLTPEERALGPRPNTKDRVLFRPGPGKVIEELDTGTVDIELTYWRIAEGPDSARTFPYVVNVT